MEDTRPSKRRKIAQERNPFIDDEAVVDYDESEEDTDNEDEFIEHETVDDLNNDGGLHARVDAAMRGAEEAELNEAHSTEEEQEEEQEPEAIAVELSPQDGLWELPCQIGQEIDALQALLAGDVDNNVPIVKSATFREDHPGRIYIELKPGPASLNQKHEAMQVAARVSLPMLTSTSAIRFIPCPDAVALLKVDRMPWRAGMWARIRGPSRLYRGDIGFIYSRRNKTTNQTSMWVAVVPRIDLHKSKKGSARRPPAQLLDVKTLLNYRNILVDFGEEFTFQDQIFNYAGYQLFPITDLDLYPPNPFPPVPLLEEFDRFLRLPILLGEKKWTEHRLRVSQQRTGIHDRVKILDGRYKGLIGVVLSVRDQELEVYLSEKDDVVTVGLTNTQTELQHGDYVRVSHGEYEGKEGFITKIEGEWIDVINPNESAEIHTYAVDVELYTPPAVIAVQRNAFEVGDEVRTFNDPLERGFVTAVHDGWLEVTSTDETKEVFYREAEHTTKPKTNRVLDAMKKGQIDIYSLWRGRYCVVISGPFKGHRGTVKTTHPDGRIGVQLDTCLSQTIEFKFDDILVQDKELAMPLPPPVSAFLDEQALVVPEKRPLAIPFPNCDRPEPATWRPRYKAPTSDVPFIPPAIPADHKSHRLPVPYWLLERAFVPHRIKLIDITGDWKYLEYLMPVEGSSTSVHVRIGTKSQQILIENLRHILPEKKNDLVVPLVGEFKGQAMKVKDFGADQCTLLVQGAKPIQKKNHQYPTCPTDSLASIFPPLK